MTYSRDYVLVEEGAKIEALSKKMHEIEELPDYKVITNGIVLPRKNVKGSPYQGSGGVVDRQKKFVKESAIYDLKQSNSADSPLAFGGSYNFNKIVYSDKKVIYLGLAHQQWGHFLIDIVQRLWICFTKDFNLKNEYSYVFSGFGDDKTFFGKNYQEFFRLLGIDIKDIEIINVPTQFKEIIVPNVSVYPGEYIHSVYRDIFASVSKKAKEETIIPIKKNIYFSRSHLKDLKEIGENKIEIAMEKAGFEILYPEELTLCEQIFYWQTADKIACVCGTIPHNCVFASKKLDLYIFSKTSNVVGYQFTMDMVWKKQPIYVSAYREPFKIFPLDVSRGPFWIFPTEMFRKFIEDNTSIQIEDNKFNFLEYSKYILLCILVTIKYILRGTKSRIKRVFKCLYKGK